MKVAAGDPVVQSLLEALDGRPAAPTLVWGRGMARVSRDLGQDAPVHTLLQDARDVHPKVGQTTHGMTAPDGPFERVVTRLPRSKDALRWRLSSAAAALPEGGEVWLAGHQREGIKSSVRLMEEAV
ncbi:MAG: hypothetical protein QF464_23820, partial [Myxococcota bacterium]|nr:hypothetical protein [Myxococcota bacterium]